MDHARKSHQEFMAKARRTMAYLKSQSAATGMSLADFMALVVIEDRLASFRWWKVWRWRQHRQDMRWAARGGRRPLAMLRRLPNRADQWDEEGQQQGRAETLHPARMCRKTENRSGA